jgi:hypothetical protein
VQAATLAASGVTAGTVGDATHVPVVTVNAKGLVTALGTATVAAGGNVSGPVSSTTGDLASYSDATGKVIADSGVPAAQVARKDQINTFTADHQLLTNAGQVGLRFYDTSQPANAGMFRMLESSGILYLQATDDAVTVQQGAVTVDRTGQLSSGGLNATELNRGIVADARLSTNVALLTASNVFTNAVQQISAATPQFWLVDPTQPVDQKRWLLYTSSGVLILGALNDAGNTWLSQTSLSRAGNLSVPGTYTESSRSTPLGYWQDVPFNAANFSALSPMTATVVSGDIYTNRYTLVGKTLTWVLYFYGSATLGGTAQNSIYYTLPGGYVAARNGLTVCRMLDGAGWKLAQITSSAGVNYLTLLKIDATVFALGTLGTQMTVTVEIQ